MKSAGLPRLPVETQLKVVDLVRRHLKVGDSLEFNHKEFEADLIELLGSFELEPNGNKVKVTTPKGWMIVSF
jgi:hypothetical protein